MLNHDVLTPGHETRLDGVGSVLDDGSARDEPCRPRGGAGDEPTAVRMDVMPGGERLR
jgi:hypothetical protein